MTHPNARFWVYLDGPVKLTLRPGETLRWSQARLCDEGWTRSLETWIYDTEDEPGLVTRQWLQQGRDCDGTLEHGGEDVCDATNLLARPPYPEDEPLMEGVRWPAWRDANRWQRDHSAEAAGY
jgi:hypothetical protein